VMMYCLMQQQQQQTAGMRLQSQQLQQHAG
jgi:hypothetical protein